MARAALVAHGIRNERLLDELSLDPAEVLAQVERLQQEVMRGGVTNPAGWLVEAIRGRYGEAAQDVGGTMMDRAEHPPAHGAAAVGSTPAAPGALAWQTVCAELRTEVTAENFERWFAPAVALSYDGQRLSVAVPDAFHQQWLDRRLRSTVERVASRVLRDTEIVFVVAGRASA